MTVKTVALVVTGVLVTVLLLPSVQFFGTMLLIKIALALSLI